MRAFTEEYQEGLVENVVAIKRVSKMTKGGRVFKISAWVVVGDKMGRVGVGHASAKETPEAIEKARRKAQKNMKQVVLWRGTLPHPVFVKFGSTKLLMKPAAPGTGIIACQPVRAVLEAAGYQNVLTKYMGGRSVVNRLKATMMGLLTLKDPHQVAEARGKKLEHIMRRFGGGKKAEDKAKEEPNRPAQEE